MKEVLWLFRCLLLMNTSVGVWVMYGDKEDHSATFYEGLFLIQLVILFVILILLVKDAIRNRSFDRRLACGLAYIASAFWTTEVILHTREGHQSWIQSNLQIFGFVLEVILLAILLRNQFYDEVYET